MRSISSPVPIDPHDRFFRAHRPFWVICAYILWGVLVLLSVGLFILSLPAAYAVLHQVCAANVCLLPWQLSPSDRRMLDHMGLSIDFYAFANLLLAMLLR